MCILYCCEGRKLDNSLGYYVTYELYCIVLGMPRSLSRARFACVQFSPAFEKKKKKKKKENSVC